MNPICVCSDPGVSKKRTETDFGERIEDLGMPATTDPKRIAEQHGRGEGLTVVFSTYQSLDAVAAAQAMGLPEFSLAVCDEAHRTTGKIIEGEDESSFTKIHSDSSVRARKRLYMTATPRIYGVKGKEDARKASASKSVTVALCSMDDEEIYGGEFYNLSFGKAVEMGLLSDYKVLILTAMDTDVPEPIRRQWGGGKDIDVDSGCKIWGTLSALAKIIANDDSVRAEDPGPMRSAVSFCRTISDSKRYAERFNEIAKASGSPIALEMRHIDGGMNAMARDGLMGWLKGGGEGCRALTNVRCLSEGVDVPALDAVVFMSSKGSLVDVVQSVGRVMRRSEGKRFGYVVIPIVVEEGRDAEEALDDNKMYKEVWQVLRALRSHDERIEAEINAIQYRTDNAGGRIRIGRAGGGGEWGGDRPWARDGQWTLDDFSGKLYAKLVLKVGDREYIRSWMSQISEVMPSLIEKLEGLCKGAKGAAFKEYMAGLRSCVNYGVSEKDGINMLAQQIVTEPIFDRLFGSDGFSAQNPVSRTIKAMLDGLGGESLGEIEKALESFHRSVEDTLGRIDTAQGKQKVVTELYEGFFKKAFGKDQQINGVVYTPQEIVDFIIRSASDALRREFGIDVNDAGVNVLDPFTGTGTFIARLIESGAISKESLERKYREELFANEITLLAYYIAAVNIENAYAGAMGLGQGEYVPFENIVLTDTFNIEEICRQKTSQASLLSDDEVPFKINRDKIVRGRKKPITLIVGNPPYGANQKSANDDAKRKRYENGVDGRIRETYLDKDLFTETVKNVNSTHDGYVRAFRWSTDRIGDSDGAIAFVTPSGWLSGSAFIGFRKCIESEFSKIYILDLRGDATTQGEARRKEGDGVFGDGSRTAITITLLIKRKGFKGKAKIRYYKVADRMKRGQKLDLLGRLDTFGDMEKSGLMEALDPKENGDWIIQRKEGFQKLIPLAGDSGKRFDKHVENTLFSGYTRGYCTSRDSWAYNFSKMNLNNIKLGLVEGFNEQIKSGKMDFGDSRVKWTAPLRKTFDGKKTLSLDSSTLCIAAYRPFTKMFFDNDPNLNERSYQMPRLFPTPDAENLVICISSIGDKKDFSCLIVDLVADLHITGSTQCLPLYWYDNLGELRAKRKQKSLDDSESIVRHDGISDYALRLFRERYGGDVAKEDVFFYVYGYLHSPEYREAYAEDLKLSLPRIGLVGSGEDFWAFSRAGRALADLHLNYERVDPPESLVFSGSVGIEDALGDDGKGFCRVTKMKLSPEERSLVYNQHITIENIPEEAFEYKVNGRAALGWIVDQYQCSTDKYSGIVNDPNEYAGGRYVLKLALSVIGVSVKTMEIVKNMPRLDFDPDLDS